MKRIRYKPLILNGVDMTGIEVDVEDSAAQKCVEMGWADILEEKVETPETEPVEEQETAVMHPTETRKKRKKEA